ncbi:MAG: DUF3179 domain-containing protein [Xanthomonadales bacterium]|nr:DUF3179 domain-containing protein [Xanthomonadales bacterium]
MSVRVPQSGSSLPASRICLAVLIVLLVKTAAAGPQPLANLNSGLNDAWFSPTTPGQGFLLVVFPNIQQVFVAWFTYDTERPPQDVAAILGDPGHRWLTAQGPYQGTRADLTLFVTRGGVFNAPTPVPNTDSAGEGTLTLEFADCTQGMVTYNLAGSGLSGEIPIQRVADDNVALCETLAASEPMACERPAPDLSHGIDNPSVLEGGATLPNDEVFDAGPGPDGIPPLEDPQFVQGGASLAPSELVVGVKIGDQIRAYPHNILNWHEIVNDRFTVNGTPEGGTISYCPLTGSAVLWQDLDICCDASFGTTGLLHNSNLILYDRATGSFWSQMLEQSVFGNQITAIPKRLQVIETTWATWRAMYPDTLLLSEDTGFSRDYNDYPYGTFRTDNSLLWPVNNEDDDRLGRKERVLGINVGDASRVYPISGFASDIEVLNERVGAMDVVVIGSSGLNLGAVYNRELADCTKLQFEPVQDQLPVVMRDNLGSDWDAFGVALSGPLAGTQLQKTNSYIAFWFAWTAFFPGADIRQ